MRPANIEDRRIGEGGGRPNNPARALSALQALDPGCCRDEWVRIAMAAKAAGLELEDFDAWSSTAANYAGSSDTASVWRSIRENGGVTAATLFGMARAAGWRDGPGARPQNGSTGPHAKVKLEPGAGKRMPLDSAVVWEASERATAEHPYIVAKRGSPAGLRVYRGPLVIAGQACDGALIVPAYDMAGAITTLQFIPTAGKKVNAPGHPVAGAFVVGRIIPPGTDQTIYIVEGIGQAWACHQATGSAAVVSFGSGRMETVGKAFAERYPAARLVLVADAGKEHLCARIAKDLRAAWVEMPPGSPQNYDANDYAADNGPEALAALLRSPKEPAEDAPEPHPLDALVRFDPITPDELAAATLAPRCILSELLYADVRTRISAGGTGKTTLALFEAVLLALGRPLWGREPADQRKTAIMTREDSRPILAARMREIMAAMHLTAAEVGEVLRRVRIIDLSGVNFRLSTVVDDVVIPHAPNLNWLIDRLGGFAPDWIVFDPLVSFGVGEQRVNDSEQGLIEAFRVLRNQLGACVEGIHHSGKVNAREKSLDQYSGRGGSALSDGCRMVAVMQPLDADEWHSMTGTNLDDTESGIVMALPKLSYAPPQEPIYIRRTGYQFQQVTPHVRSPEQRAEAVAEQLAQFIRHEYQQGRRYSQQDLENSRGKMGLSRAEIRAAATALKVAGRIIYHHENGKPGSHFEPVTVAERDGDGTPETPEMDGRTSESVAA